MSLASRHLGWEAAWLSEIEAFPSAVLAHRWPDVPNVGDMRAIPARIRSRVMEAPPFFTGGTPCFTAGHMVQTERGYVSIETVREGDMVVTHLGRLRKVLRTGSKVASVGKLSMVGRPNGLTVTPEHPLRSVTWRRTWPKPGTGSGPVDAFSEATWTPAQGMPGKQWCALTEYEPIPCEVASSKFSTLEAMYVAGMYLGDGHIRRWEGKSKKAVVLSLNEAKLAKLASIIGEDGYTITRERTSTRATICDTVLADWLIENFGELSHCKRIPAWVLSHPQRTALLAGYTDTDGHRRGPHLSIATTSAALAYGAADLLAVEGYASSVALVSTAPTTQIEGRTVNQRDYYLVRAFASNESRKSRRHQGYLLRMTSSYSEIGADTVYNIEVEGDNSYVVNGVVVHNCQAFSVAGNRNSLSDARGSLSLTFCEIADAIDDVRSADGLDPCIVQWENVPGCLSTDDNAFGCFLAGLAGERDPLEPGPRPEPGRSSVHWRWKADAGVHVPRWPNAGCVAGPRRTVAWRVLDAQFFGLAQRRERVFVVASARDGFSPGRVLFESEGVRRDSAPRREAGGGSACGTLARTSPGGGWRVGADEAAAGQLIPVVFMAHGQGGAEVLRDHAPTLTCNHEAPIAAYGDALSEPYQAVTGALCAADGKGTNGQHAYDHKLMPVIFGPMGRIHEALIAAHDGVTHTLRADGFDASEDGTGRGTPLIPVMVGTDMYNRLITGDVAATLGTQSGDGLSSGPSVMVPVSVDLRGREGGSAAELGDDCASTLRASSGGGDKPHVLAPIAFDTTNITSAANRSNPKPGDPCHTLAAGAHPPAIAFSCKDHGGDVAPTLRAMGNGGSHANAGGKVAVAFSVDAQADQLPTPGRDTSISDTLTCSQRAGVAYTTKLHNTKANNAGKFFFDRTVALDASSPPPALITAMAVRRLTPRECERLQGMQDDHTLIPIKKGRPKPLAKIDAAIPVYDCMAEAMQPLNRPRDKKDRFALRFEDGKAQVYGMAADGPRYKAIGNSWAVLCVSWILDRIQREVHRLEHAP